MFLSDCEEINITKGSTISQKIGIDFNNIFNFSTQPAQFDISSVYTNDPSLGGTSTTRQWLNLSIAWPIGELLQPGWNIS